MYQHSCMFYNSMESTEVYSVCFDRKDQNAGHAKHMYIPTVPLPLSCCHRLSVKTHTHSYVHYLD